MKRYKIIFYDIEEAIIFKSVLRTLRSIVRKSRPIFISLFIAVSIFPIQMATANFDLSTPKGSCLSINMKQVVGDKIFNCNKIGQSFIWREMSAKIAPKLNLPRIVNTLDSQPSISVPKSKPSADLIIRDEKIGTGRTLSAPTKIQANYVLKVWSDSKFTESSWGQGARTFDMSTLIKGWKIGLLGMKEGGRRLVIIPPRLGYGSAGGGPIKPNETLVFLIDLISFNSDPQKVETTSDNSDESQNQSENQSQNSGSSNKLLDFVTSFKQAQILKSISDFTYTENRIEMNFRDQIFSSMKELFSRQGSVRAELNLISDVNFQECHPASGYDFIMRVKNPNVISNYIQDIQPRNNQNSSGYTYTLWASNLGDDTNLYFANLRQSNWVIRCYIDSSRSFKYFFELKITKKGASEEVYITSAREFYPAPGQMDPKPMAKCSNPGNIFKVTELEQYLCTDAFDGADYAIYPYSLKENGDWKYEKWLGKLFTIYRWRPVATWDLK